MGIKAFRIKLLRTNDLSRKIGSVENIYLKNLAFSKKISLRISLFQTIQLIVQSFFFTKVFINCLIKKSIIN